MLEALYPTKTALKQSVGKALVYNETSIFQPEYKASGKVYVVGPNKELRRWFAEVELKGGRICKVR